MHEVLIPKKTKGEFRTVVVMTPDEKRANKQSLISAQITHTKFIHECSHGFVRGRNAVSNALAHVKFRYSLCLDLKDFFDSVKPHHVEKLFGAKTKDFFYKDRAAQGMPSSPFIANLAARGMDEGIHRQLPPETVYTRYADDLTVSFNDISLYLKIKNVISSNAGKNGFKINKKKTRLLDGEFYNRIITGVSIKQNAHKEDFENPLVPTRQSKRKLRAVNHRIKKTGTKIHFAAKNEKSCKELYASYRNLKNVRGGLAEWHKLKIKSLKDKINFGRLDPFQKDVKGDAVKIFSKVVLHPDYELRNKYLSRDVVITNDLAYILLPSDYGGWTSCFKKGHSSWDRAVAFFPRMEDIKVGVLLDDGELVVSGVKRPKLLARCFIYKAVNGKYYHGRIFSNSNADREALIKTLSENGIGRSNSALGKCENAIYKWEISRRTPYLDDLRYCYSKNTLTFI